MKLFDCFREIRTLDLVMLWLIASGSIIGAVGSRVLHSRIDALERQLQQKGGTSHVTAVTADNPG